jgi:von Willebrand factor type A domain/PEP-CTERM motif
MAIADMHISPIAGRGFDEIVNSLLIKNSLWTEVLMIKRFKLHAAAAGVALALGAAAPAQAGVIQLGFILDRSGSVGSTDWGTIVTGLSSAVNSLLPTNSSYEVSVVTFSTAATANIQNVLVDSAATRQTLANNIAALPYSGGNTNYAAAFSTMQTVFGQSNQSVDFSYVNFATDGEPNTGGNGVTERNALITAGVDNLSIEGIGISVSAANFLKNSICYPQSCDDVSPFNFPTQGFYVGVSNAAGYAAAIGNKIRVVTQQVPEPGTMLLLGASLLGFGFARRRKV